jgi:hypothetical protein
VKTPEEIRRPYQIEASTPARCPPATVVRLILDPSTWPRWQPEIMSTSGASPLSEGDVVRGEARMLGFLVQGHSTAIVAGDRSFDQDAIVGIRMRVRYEIDPGDGGSLVTHRITADLPSGLAGRILSFFLRRRLKRLQRTTLQNLVTQCEDGRT